MLKRATAFDYWKPIMNETNGEADRGKDTAGSENPSEQVRSAPALSILIVEDEAIVAQDLYEFLRELQYEVVGIASRGQEALRMARERRPNLIVMDVRLNGEMDGIQTAAAILEHLDIPIIFLTGQTDSDTLSRAVMAGPMAYLVKPFKDAELRGAIELAVLKHRAESEQRAREAELRRNAQMLQSLSLVDELTSLKNRRGFFALAEQELKIAHREQQTVVLFFIDLNGLKHINDEHGHAAGDIALRDAATVLSQTFRESDILARLGGDEFVVLTRSQDNDVVYAIKNRLREQLTSFNQRAQRPFTLDMSIGAAPVEDITAETIDAILARADAAMYEDKRKRSNRTGVRAR
ncbi:MAG TPA: diguanylate cyclase [Steroidobacteraceae bacterium]|nr:diguanylate cyclase [Steroidobacteraceae bacterium]